MRKVMMVVGAVAVMAVSAWANCGSCPGNAKKGEGVCKAETKECTECKGEKEAKRIDTAGVAALVDAKAAVVLLDARTGKYDDGRRLPGARGLSPVAPKEDIEKALPDKKARIVTYCAGVKCPASHKLAERLVDLGYENVSEYAEGIEGWVKAGHAVENAK